VIDALIGFPPVPPEKIVHAALTHSCHLPLLLPLPLPLTTAAYRCRLSL